MNPINSIPWIFISSKDVNMLFTQVVLEIEGILKYRTRAAPRPPTTSMNSVPFMERKGTSASDATAFASKVFPQPGGPNRSTPFGI